MKTFSILVGVLSVSAVFAAAAEDAAEAPAADKEYGSPDAGKDQSRRMRDELEWRDFENSDRGTTFRDFWEARKKLEPPTKLPQQATPIIDGAIVDESDPPKDGSPRAEAEADPDVEPKQVELPEQSESVRKPKETLIPNKRINPQPAESI